MPKYLMPAITMLGFQKGKDDIGVYEADGSYNEDGLDLVLIGNADIILPLPVKFTINGEFAHLGLPYPGKRPR